MDIRLLVKKPKFFTCFLVVLLFAGFASGQSLTLADVQTVIAQAVSKASSLNQRVTVSVTDKEGNLLGTFQMNGAAANTLISGGGRAGQGLEARSVPATLAAHSKAGTAGIFSTGGNAFSTRTAAFIIQEHFPAGVDNRPGGPLYGVQFSTLVCSDVAIAALPLGLSGDSGGMPLYKGGVAVGGVGVEGDGIYTVDRDPSDDDQSVEELIAVYATKGYEAPALIRGDNILVEGVRFPFSNVTNPGDATPIAFGSLPGIATSPLRAAPASDFVPGVLGGVSGQFSSRFPIVSGSTLSAAEVTQILTAAAQAANRVRAGIRQPIGTNARVNITVVDTTGKILGIFRQLDAPVFGLDVSAQKARTTNFFARSDAGTKLTAAGLGSFVTRAAADGITLNGSIAFSDRAFGFLHRPLFPDGINDTQAGPFSTSLGDWSPFNVGIQLDLVRPALLAALSPNPPVCRGAEFKKKDFLLAVCPCSTIPELPNGIQTFAGGLPIYRGSVHVGAIGVSGDGIDQDDLIASSGANLFPPPANMRADRIFVRGVRLPFLKFPVRPFVDE